MPTDTSSSSTSNPNPPESPALERRLAAILAADVAGYSRLMHADEERTLATLTAHRKVIDELIVAANGQIFNTAGDSVLAEFPSVVEAYHAAIAIQRALGKANAELSEEARMEMRVGINVGDVMVKGGEVFGDGVNIASRLESLAEPGAICVSRAARDQLRDRVDMNFADLGEHSVKNIDRPVRAFRVIFDRNAEPELPASVRRADVEADAQPEQASDSDSVEIAFWHSVEASDDDAEYQLYLEHYPEGAFAELAGARLRGVSSVDDTSVELLFWDTVRDGKDAAMIRAYCERYPEGRFRSLADIMLAKFGKESP